MTAFACLIGFVSGSALAAVLLSARDGQLGLRTFGVVLAASLLPLGWHYWFAIDYASSYGIGDMSFGYYPAFRQFMWLVPVSGVLLFVSFWMAARRVPVVTVLLPAVSYVLYVTLGLPWLTGSVEAVVLDNKPVIALFVLSAASCTGLFGFLLMTLGGRKLFKPWPTS